MSIEVARARVEEIKYLIQQKTSISNYSTFQSVLNDRLSDEDTAVSSVDSADTTASGSASLSDSTGELTATGRYCAKCGMPEYESCTSYAEMYAGSVSTADGMLEKAAPYMDIIQQASSTYDLPVNLIMGVIKAESDYNENCVSSAGAMGLMQIMPVNAEEFGVTDAFDPEQNIFCGCDEIARHLETYNGDLKLALAAYNTGAGNVAKHGVTSSSSEEYLNIPQSIRDYVDRVLEYSGISI